MTTPDNIETLRQKIVTAFSDVEYPSGPLIEHDCEECRGLEKTFTRKDWRTIDFGIVKENYDQLPLFSPPAFQYFLPAYLLHSIERIEDEDICEFTVYSVTPQNQSLRDSFEYQSSRINVFTDGQIAAIKDFLGFVATHEGYINLVRGIEKGKNNLDRLRSGELSQR